MENKKILVFSDSELLNIHKALHDKRRKYVTVKGVEREIFEHNALRQIKFTSTIFSEFKDNNAKFVDKATIAIKLDKPIKYWKVIKDNKVFKNKRDYYAKVQQ